MEAEHAKECAERTGMSHVKNQNFLMIFGSLPGMGVSAHTNLLKEVVDIYLENYETKFLTLLLPDCFEVFNSYENVELVTSNTI